MNKVLKFISLVVLIVSFQSNSFSKENFFNEAIKLYEKKKYEDARFLFERNIVFNPKDANSYLYLAKYKYEFASFGLNTIFLSNKNLASSYFFFSYNLIASLKKFSFEKELD